MRYKLADDVFYRLYGDKVVLYKTMRKKTYIFNGSSIEFFDAFEDYVDKEVVMSAIIEKYSLNNEEVASSFSAFIDSLVEQEVIVPENILFEDKNSIESTVRGSVIPELQLYAAQIELTFRCNEKCQHCYCTLNDSRPELSLSEIKAILDELADMNVFEVTFTGGDLFVREDAFEILEYAYSKRFLINIFTNGIALTDADFFKLYSIHPRSIHFSIYSNDAKRHDEFTRVPGSFNKTVSAIKKCQALGIPVNIKTCVLDYNADEIEDILSLAQKLNTTIQLSMAVNARNDGDTAPLRFRLNTPEDYADVMIKVNRNIEIHCSGDYHLVRRNNNRICGAGYSAININPYGDVFPCNALLVKCGNIREQSLREIWEKSEELRRIRGFSMDDVEGCQNCKYINTCNFCPGSALNETGNALMKYSEACIISKAKYIAEGGESNV